LFNKTEIGRFEKLIDGFNEEYALAWILKITRNTCYTALKRNPPGAVMEVLDETTCSDLGAGFSGSSPTEPPALIARAADVEQIRAAVNALPHAFREVVVLRELEELSYSEIAAAVEIPVGTVMSRLSRARRLLKEYLGQPTDGDNQCEL
jgi:RNA polymerase sigma factor (sigma-70 family)